ncbi:MAG TPA: pectin acetylesterase-family hydrolase [Gaiellaceae bacterium]|nr:pectin acetylesterase-family hydrolase [Gaiellaceae bacterium]
MSARVLGVVLLASALGAVPAGATERSSSAARVRPPQLAESCVTRDERRRVVRFAAADGARLVGVLLGAGPRVVVLAHQGGGGAPGNLCAWMPYARILRTAGYRVLVFDHRGFGSSPYVIRRSSRVDLDVIGAVKFVRSRGATQVILGGASLGGAAVVAAGAAIKPSVNGVFTVGATHTYESVDALAAARRLTAPVLFVAAARDDAGRFAEEAREMYEASPSSDKRVVIYPGSPHGAPQLRSRRPRGLVTGWIRDHFAAASLTDAGGWERIEPGGRTACARGGRYAFWLRRADPKRLVIFFQGGGGCFDVRSCAPGSTWFDDRVDEGDDPAFNGGLLDVGDSRNPFRDWSFLYIPSCTGDVHLGDRVMRYGATTIRHRGWVNARAGLARSFHEFPAPETVLVTGCSAGSVGSAFHVPTVLARWPRARVTQIGDSLAFVFHRPVRLVDWGAPAHFPSFFRIGNRRFTMVEYLRAVAKRYPRRTFARFNYASDAVQERFYAAVGGQPAGFEPRLRRAEAQLKRLPNYRSYLACGSDHCVLPRESFFTLRVAGVRVREWVERLTAGQSVGCPTCRS